MRKVYLLLFVSFFFSCSNIKQKKQQFLKTYHDSGVYNFEELMDMNLSELRIKRNEIYARRGYIFNSKVLQEVFSKEGWYKPKYRDVSQRLDEIDKINIKLVLKAEKFKKQILILSNNTNGPNAQKLIYMAKINNIYHVPMRVNNIDMFFIIDEHKDAISISLEEVLFMYKEGSLSEDDIFGTKDFSLANGKIKNDTKIILRELCIGNIILKNIGATIVDDIEAPMLVGKSFLENFSQFTVDYDTGIISVHAIN
ncbi:YARHG domain-containing protein [Draconibacterium sediminis]|uniref:YARHG domain-containing protein n=1 Tax=Draconibacterium sediminis TaxID=1544798 RepID=UPI0006964B75|nr:YARHG domain-containing protein [Draconibacterium sediminis]